VAAAVEKVRDLGGTASDPAEMPYGARADCTDDQGMAFYLWQPPADAAPAAAGAEPDLAYLVLNVVDSGRFRAFFGDLLGWRFRPGRVEDGWEVDGSTPLTGVGGGATRHSAVPMYRVDDIETAVDRVRAAGGAATAVETMPYGRTSDCTDDQGTPFYLGQL
jgi:predicted enzyme related to lactoylglutathione lyase